MPELTPNAIRREILGGQKRATILEIGANDGEDTVKFFRTFRHPDTQIYCFECDPRAIEKWKKTAPKDRCQLFEVALADSPGTRTFHQSGGKPPGRQWEQCNDWDKSGSLLPNDQHTVHSPWLNFNSTIEVQCMTLDDWAVNYPGIFDFCWMDVQGGELMVLRGGIETLPRIRYMYCECDPRPNYQGQCCLDELSAFFSQHNFSYVGEYDGFNHLWKNNNPRATSDPPSPPVESQITVHFWGQFGNQLFQYVAGKIMSEVSGLSFTPPSTFLTKSGQPVTWNGPPLFVMQPSEGTRQARGGPHVEHTTMQWIDWQSLAHANSVTLKGYFQRYECLKPWKQQIKEWLTIQRPFVETDPEAVYVHCRLTDYVRGVDNPNDPSRHGISTTIEEYRRCLKHFPDAKKMVICTDAPNDPWLKNFDQISLPWTVSTGTWDDDFLSMASCRWLLIAQSTFSWWAGFLGQAERIVCPLSPKTIWHYGKNVFGPPRRGRDFPNLIVDDEPGRWIWEE